MRLASIAALIGLGLALTAPAALAGSDFDFSGTFQNDNDVVELSFTVGAASNVTIFSSSWLSGNSGLGFDPILAVWDSTGALVAEQDDGGITGTTISNGVTYNHGEWDSHFTLALSPGDYVATIAQYDNFAAGTHLIDGFTYDGNPDFTFDMFGGTYPLFNGVWDAPTPEPLQRTGNWEFHVLDVEQASVPPTPPTQAVPLPAAAPIGLALMGLLGLARSIRRRRTS